MGGTRGRREVEETQEEVDPSYLPWKQPRKDRKWKLVTRSFDMLMS